MKGILITVDAYEVKRVSYFKGEDIIAMLSLENGYEFPELLPLVRKAKDEMSKIPILAYEYRFSAQLSIDLPEHFEDATELKIADRSEIYAEFKEVKVKLNSLGGLSEGQFYELFSEEIDKHLEMFEELEEESRICDESDEADWLDTKR